MCTSLNVGKILFCLVTENVKWHRLRKQQYLSSDLNWNMLVSYMGESSMPCWVWTLIDTGLSPISHSYIWVESAHCPTAIHFIPINTSFVFNWSVLYIALWALYRKNRQGQIDFYKGFILLFITVKGHSEPQYMDCAETGCLTVWCIPPSPPHTHIYRVSSLRSFNTSIVPRHTVLGEPQTLSCVTLCLRQLSCIIQQNNIYSTFQSVSRIILSANLFLTNGSHL